MHEGSEFFSIDKNPSQTQLRNFEMSFKYPGCVYRSKDPVRNFKIKVTLQRATGKLSAPKPEPEDPNIKELEALKKKAEKKHHKNVEEVVVNWQTKIFSKREYLKYTNPSFKPQTILEEHYTSECLKLKERNYQPGRIFTYIDADPYEFYDEIDGEANTAPKSVIPSYLQRVTFNLKRRKPLVGRQKAFETTVPRKNIVNYSPNIEDKKRFFSKILPFHTMYIMADLSTSENTFTMNDECVLCCIKIDSNGAILMKPSFSRSSYYVQTTGFARETYEYYLEHVSDEINADDLIRERRLHKELYQRHSEYIRNLVGTKFKMPDLGVLKVHVFGEILKAVNFDYDDLHVYYQLDLPKNWHVDGSLPMSGFSQTSRTRVEGRDEVAYFAHPFEFDLYYKNDEERDFDEIIKMPKILFEVASYDSWNRYRTEGYTWTQLPMKPGISHENLPCWRPRGDSLIYELRRFFIGGSPELEDITYAAIPSDNEGSILSRFGFRTYTTGSLIVKLNMVFQSQVFMSNQMRQKYKTIEREENPLLKELNAILEQFHMSKAKMMESREGLKKALDDLS